MPLTIIYSSTLRPDTALIHAFQQSGDYDYSKELFQSNFSIWGWLWDHAVRFLSRIFRGVPHIGHVPLWVWVLLAVMVLILIVGVFVIRKRGLFYRNRQVEEEEADEDDNIYGVDFEAALAKALTKKTGAAWCAFAICRRSRRWPMPGALTGDRRRHRRNTLAR